VPLHRARPKGERDRNWQAGCCGASGHSSLEVLVKTRLALLSFTVAIFIAAVSWSGLALAQQNNPAGQQAPSQAQQPPDSQVPPSAAQDPAQTGQQNPGQSQPDQTTNQSEPGQRSDQAQSDTSTREFVGTVVKQGDKYVLQDSATGTIYDIDHQDEVSKFEGKKVRVHGALDSNGKMIHLQ
jgi:hypothetical protein